MKGKEVDVREEGGEREEGEKGQEEKEEGSTVNISCSYGLTHLLLQLWLRRCCQTLHQHHCSLRSV